MDILAFVLGRPSMEFGSVVFSLVCARCALREYRHRFLGVTLRFYWLALVLLKWLHHLSKAGWSLSNLASMLRLNLFTYRNLRDWLDDPFNTPPIEPLPEQLELALP